MTLSKLDGDAIATQVYENVARALLIREFWRHGRGTNIFEFSFNNNDKGDELSVSMSSAFYRLVDENILIKGPPQSDFHNELGILKAFDHKDNYYEENTDISKIEAIYTSFLSVRGNLQYSIEKQDEELKNILSEVFKKFGRIIRKLNLFTFVQKNERTEYYQYSNLFLGLLRLEKEKYISIEWLGSYCFLEDTNEYFAECSISMLDEEFFNLSARLPAHNTEKIESSKKVIDIKIVDNYCLVVNNTIIETTPIQKSYLKSLSLEELLDGLSMEELAGRYEQIRLDDDKWERAKKRVKNAFTTLNSKINASAIHKKDIFVVSQATGISLNGLYDFEISST